MKWVGLAVVIAVIGATWYWQTASDPNRVTLLNVSYDPTRELWREVNEAFIADFEARTGKKLTIRQSHGGSSSQARAVMDGLRADVVTLALWPDTDALRHKELLADNWQARLPFQSLPYYSTIVFVVRKGNPKGIGDWPDLVKPGVGVVTPNPKTSGNGKLSYLAAWGSVKSRGGSDELARDYVKALYENVLVLDAGARGSAVTFAKRKIGDVHLTWENEAQLEVREAKGELEIVYPASGSVKAEPFVAWVDAVVERKGTTAIAKEYLEFLFTDVGQEIIAKNGYRPIRPEILAKHRGRLPDVKLYAIPASWDEVQRRFFASGALFDQIYRN